MQKEKVTQLVNELKKVAEQIQHVEVATESAPVEKVAVEKLDSSKVLDFLKFFAVRQYK